MQVSIKINHCPFCNYPPIKGYIEDTGEYVYLCASCYFRSDFEPTEYKTILNWNKKCREYEAELAKEENNDRRVINGTSEQDKGTAEGTGTVASSGSFLQQN